MNGCTHLDETALAHGGGDVVCLEGEDTGVVGGTLSSDRGGRAEGSNGDDRLHCEGGCDWYVFVDVVSSRIYRGEW